MMAEVHSNKALVPLIEDDWPTYGEAGILNLVTVHANHLFLYHIERHRASICGKSYRPALKGGSTWSDDLTRISSQLLKILLS